MVEYLDIRSEMENKRLVAKRYSTMKGADSHYPFLKGEQKIWSRTRRCPFTSCKAPEKPTSLYK